MREPQAGRATVQQGAVFRYEALAPGQTLVGAILCPDEASAARVQALLEKEETWLLGGSQSAGYGLAVLREIKQDAEWQETTQPPSWDRDEYLTLTLLSDAILRDARGHYTGFLTPEMLTGILDVSLTPEPARTHAERGVAGGFNRKWGLPLPQTPVAKAGSVFTFKVEGKQLSSEDLQGLEEEGLGERRVEGFGRVAVNRHVAHARLAAIEVEEGRSVPLTVPALEGASARLAGKMTTQLLRRRLDHALRECVNSLEVGEGIHNTQLSAVRAHVRTALATGDVESIVRYLAEMKTVGQQQFEQARIAGDQADDWIKEVMAEDAAATWKRLFRSDFGEEALPAIGGVRAGWDEALAREYALRLVDGVLSRKLAKRRKEAR
jgi:CRISPR-associated protein Csx10